MATINIRIFYHNLYLSLPPTKCKGFSESQQKLLGNLAPTPKEVVEFVSTNKKNFLSVQRLMLSLM